MKLRWPMSVLLRTRQLQLHSCCSCSPFLGNLGEIWPLRSRVYPSWDKGKPQPWTLVWPHFTRPLRNALEIPKEIDYKREQWLLKWAVCGGVLEGGVGYEGGDEGMAWDVRDKELHREEHTRLSRKCSPWGPSCLPQWISAESDQWNFWKEAGSAKINWQIRMIGI